MDSKIADKISRLLCTVVFMLFAVCGFCNALYDHVAMTIFCCTMMFISVED